MYWLNFVETKSRLEISNTIRDERGNTKMIKWDQTVTLYLSQVTLLKVRMSFETTVSLTRSNPRYHFSESSWESEYTPFQNRYNVTTGL